MDYFYIWRCSFLVIFAFIQSGISFDSNGANELYEKFWCWRMKRSPEFASFAGSREYNNKLEDFTEKRFEEDQEKCKEFLIQANTLIKNETDKEIKFNLKVLKSELETFIAGYTEKGFYFPISFREGVQ